MSDRTRRWLGGMGVAAALLFTVVLGFLSGSGDPPSRATSALLVLLAAVAQFGSVAMYSGLGRADPGLARTAVRNLARMGVRAHRARELAESLTGATAADMRSGVGVLSVELSWIEEGLVEAVEVWQEFHGEALKELEAK